MYTTTRRVLKAIQSNEQEKQPDILLLRKWAWPNPMRQLLDIANEIIAAEGKAIGREAVCVTAPLRCARPKAFPLADRLLNRMAYNTKPSSDLVVLSSSSWRSRFLACSCSLLLDNRHGR